MAVRIQFRRGTSIQWSSADPVLYDGELGYETNTKVIKFGDGETAWNALPVAMAGDIYAVKAGNGLTYGTGTTGIGTEGAGDSGTVVLEVDTTKVLSTSAIGAKGDLLVGTGAGTYTTLNVSTTNGQALVANNLAAGGVSWATITNPTITNGYINNDMLGGNSVTESKIRGSASVDADRSITTDKIRDGAITTEKFALNAVGTTNIIDNNVTAGKLATDAVETAKIKDLNVTTGKLANSAVTSEKVNNTVYARGTMSGLSPSSAKIHISPVGSPPIGQAGDIWFAT